MEILDGDNAEAKEKPRIVVLTAGAFAVGFADSFLFPSLPCPPRQY